MKIQNKILNIALLFVCIISSFNVAYAQNINENKVKFDKLQSVIPDHNIINSESRINLVFSFSKSKITIDHKKLNNLLPDLIGWNGPILGKNIVNEIKIKRGFFATDPIRNYKNKFNVWYINDLNSKTIENEQFKLLKNKILIDIGDYIKGSSSIWKEEVEINKFPIAKMSNDPRDITIGSSWSYVLNHELGHAIFSFEDEYEEVIGYNADYVPINKSSVKIEEVYKNIENNKKYIEQNKLNVLYFGQLDPFYYEVLEDYKSIGMDINLKKEDFEVTNYKKDFTNNKYTSDQINNLGSENSTIQSIMTGDEDNNYNIWGALKKNDIEKFLSNFKDDSSIIPYVKKAFKLEDLKFIQDKSYDVLYLDKNESKNVGYVNQSKIQVFFDNNRVIINYFIGVSSVLILGLIIKKINKW
jgi:hypothetical protein